MTITCVGLTKSYGRVQALRGLSFTARGGRCLGLLGPNGAGKTTAIKILTGLTRADGGRVTFGHAGGRGSSGRVIGYLAQTPAYYGWMTAQEYLRFVARLVGMTDAAGRDEALRLLDRLGLGNVRHRRIAGFSVGMRQRLGLAQALVGDPPVLLLDEPVSALDPVGRHEVLELIAAIKERKTVIMSTHVLADADRVCDDVVIMTAGRAVVAEPAADLRRNYASPAYEVTWSGTDLGPTLRGLDFVAAAEGDGPIHRLLLAGGDADLPRLLRALAEVPGSLERLERKTPTLEDIFLRVVRPA